MDVDTPQAEPDVPQEPPAPVISTPDAVKAAEKAALNVHKKVTMQAQPIRQYLESSVVPTLMAGLQELTKARPDNPVEYLAYYLLQNNPQGKSNPPSAKPADA